MIPNSDPRDRFDYHSPFSCIILGASALNKFSFNLEILCIYVRYFIENCRHFEVVVTNLNYEFT